MDQLFRLRHTCFVKERGWHQFDKEDSIYLASIDARLVDLIEFSRPVADPVTVSLLKMALLRQVEVLNDTPESGSGTLSL